MPGTVAGTLHIILGNPPCEEGIINLHFTSEERDFDGYQTAQPASEHTFVWSWSPYSFPHATVPLPRSFWAVSLRDTLGQNTLI